MNTALEVFLSSLTAFVIVAGGSIVTIVASQPAGTAALNKTAWIMSAVLGLVAAAKDARSFLKLPPVLSAEIVAARKTIAATTVAIISLMFLVGCKNTPPLLTPAALTQEVSLGIRVGLDVYPDATKDVAMARDLICWSASTTNADPAAIVAWLEGSGITNSNSKLIIDASLLVYEGVWTAIGTNTTTQIQPYLTALCSGFMDGLAPVSAAARVSRQILPPHLK